MITVSHALIECVQTLKTVSDTASLDAQTLLAHILNKPRSWVLAHPDATLSPQANSTFRKNLDELARGVPLPFVLSHWEFYGLNFNITQDTLIPRPETELLVEEALRWLLSDSEHRLVADVGTGSGCIAITLAKNVDDISVIGADISLPALRVASSNAFQHAVGDRILFIQTDLIPPVAKPIDLICANLPYIPTATLHTLDVVDKEPRLALNGGYDGLESISRLLRQAPQRIAHGGLILLEIDSSQATQAKHLAQKVFPNAHITILSDLAGLDRLLVLRLPNDLK